LFEPVAQNGHAVAFNHVGLTAYYFEFRFFAFPSETDVKLMLAHTKAVHGETGSQAGSSGSM
jgi:hypothetical protein